MRHRATADAASVGRRPTPLDPYPRPRPPDMGDRHQSPARAGNRCDRRPRRPDVHVLRLARRRAARARSAASLHDDTRFVSRWELTLAGVPLSLLKSGAGRLLLGGVLPHEPGPARPARRTASPSGGSGSSGSGAVEQIAVFNTSAEPDRFELRLAVWRGLRRPVRGQERGARSQRGHRRRRSTRAGARLRFRYERRRASSPRRRSASSAARSWRA